MSANVEKLSSNRIKISFEVDVPTFDAAMARAHQKGVKNINVPGFRRGKAPRRIVENLYGEGLYFEDAFDDIFPTAYQAAINEHGLKPVGQPDIDLDNIGGGKPLTFTVEVYVRPDVTLGEYKGITAPRAVFTVTEEQIDAEVQRALKRVARWVEVERAIIAGDRATIDYLGKVDDIAFEGGTAENVPLDIGSGSFIPGFEEQLVGLKAGEEKDVVVSFPEDYRATELAGKEATFHVKIHEIKTEEIPAADDEFAKDVSAFDTIKEYRADIEKKLAEEGERTAKNRSDNELVRAVALGAQMDIPNAMIEQQVDNMLRDVQMRLARQGMSLEMLMNSPGQSIEGMRAQYRVSALENVRAELVVEAICKAEKIEPTDAQVDAQVELLAGEMGREVAEVKDGFSPGDWAYVKEAAASELALDLLRKHATYVDPKAFTPLEPIQTQEDDAQQATAKNAQATAGTAVKEKADAATKTAATPKRAPAKKSASGATPKVKAPVKAQAQKAASKKVPVKKGDA